MLLISSPRVSYSGPIENFAIKEELPERDLVNTPELKPRKNRNEKKKKITVLQLNQYPNGNFPSNLLSG